MVEVSPDTVIGQMVREIIGDIPIDYYAMSSGHVVNLDETFT